MKTANTPLATKEIGWSYPTSPNAKALGFNAVGCYTLSIDGKAVKGFDTLSAAISYADRFYSDKAYSPYTLKIS